MKIQIKSVAEKGRIDKERLVLKATSNLDVGDYILLQTGYVDGSVTVGAHNTFWFPYKEVQAGDLIVVYTKSGKDNERDLDSGRKAHFFYWGKESAIWSTNRRAPVVLFAPEWVSKDPDEL